MYKFADTNLQASAEAKRMMHKHINLSTYLHKRIQIKTEYSYIGFCVAMQIGDVHLEERFLLRIVKNHE